VVAVHLLASHSPVAFASQFTGQFSLTLLSLSQ